MKVNPIFLLGEIVDSIKTIEAPPEIDGHTSPRHAWRAGYLAALQRVTEAFTEKEPQKTEGQV